MNRGRKQIMSTNQDETKQQIFNVNEAKEEMTIKLREATENAVHIQMNRSTVTDETNALERTSTLNSTVNPILQGMKTNQETDKNLMGAEDYLSRKAEAKKNEAETENVINEEIEGILYDLEIYKELELTFVELEKWSKELPENN